MKRHGLADEEAVLVAVGDEEAVFVAVAEGVAVLVAVMPSKHNTWKPEMICV
jgi:hypothetical protein